MGLGDRLGRIVKKEEKRSTPHEVDSGVPRGMEKEKIIKDDGRYLIYYRFGDEPEGPRRGKQTCEPDTGPKTGNLSAQGHGTHFPKAKECGTCQS